MVNGDYLSNRPQYVRMHNCVSQVVTCSTGVPQGTVLAPFLFTFYTSDFQYNSKNCHLQKFSDDSAIVGCIKEHDESEYRELLKRTGVKRMVLGLMLVRPRKLWLILVDILTKWCQ